MSRTALYVCAALLVAVVCCLAPLPSMQVEARSNGFMTMAGCDLSPQLRWPNGKFGRNKTGAGNAGVTVPGGPDSNIMRWTDAPVPTSFYTIRSGDVGLLASADPTKYIPGQFSEIHIRVFDIKRRFIGLVLYATNVTNPVVGTKAFTETQVGSWVLPAGSAFQVPEETCGTTVVTHTDANLKPLHTRFFFKAPVGTGTIKFRVLIKQGEQNKGSFFWPVKELILTEGAVPEKPSVPAGSNSTILPVVGTGIRPTVVGSVGRACADVCALETPLTPYCYKTATEAIADVNTLQASVYGQAACRLPMLAGCAFAGAARVDSNGYCSFRSANVAATCPAAFQGLNMSDPTTYQPDVCYTAPTPEAQAICVCTNNIAFKTANPFEGQTGGGGGEGGLNSAATAVNSNGALVALFAALVAFVSTSGSSKSSRSLFVAVACVALVVALAAPVSAHNYIKSVHRAYEAAVSVPCQQRVGNQPHVQVVANQPFETEWSVGHGDYTVGPFYFVIVPLSEYDQLRADNITAIIKDYVKLAPLSAYRNQSSDAAMWEKHHIRLNTTGENANKLNPNGVMETPKYDMYFKEPWGLKPTDALFYPREISYMDKAHPSQYTRANHLKNLIIQTRFQDEYIKKDVRVSYNSPKYPWIETVDIFENPLKEHYVYNNQANLARFSVPARHGAGDYVAWFYWSGYKDCIDINVMPGTAPVALRYGYNTTGQLPTIIKQDHCEYTYIPNARTKAYRINNVTRDISQCIADCRKVSCTGIQVIRGVNPTTALPAMVNLPYVQYANNQTAVDLKQPNPCGAFLASDRATNGCQAGSTANLRDTWQPALTEADYICFGVNPLRNQDNQVEEDYTIASDPLDPVFYNTCYQFAPVGGFLDVPDWTYSPPTWSVGDMCVDCAFHNSLRKLNVSQVPDWSTPGALRAPTAGAGCIDCDLYNSKLSRAQLQAQISGPNMPNAGI